jgi:ribose/xylose/arabinose/galactoside ABC-type transport system permease subunit
VSANPITPETRSVSTGPAQRLLLLRRGMGDNGALIGLAILVVVLALLAPNFLHAQNLLNIGVQAAVVAVLAFGQTFAIVTGGIDLSVGSVAALSAMTCAALTADSGVPALVGVAAALATGLACGLVSGAMVAYGRLPAFIATLAMLSVGRGLTLVISQGIPKSMPGTVAKLGSNLTSWLPAPVLVMALMGVIAAVILNRTYSGRAMYAIGGNEEAARLSGINVRRQTLVVYGLAGVFAAVAGLLLAGRLASAQPQMASGYELDAIAAVVIGGASLSGGSGRASGTLIGALILAVIRNGLNLLAVSSFWQQVVIGIVIALAVLVDSIRRRLRK